ncbi:MAG: HAMP domain-containing sensor histidine kinase [Clostridium sp.]|uniref:sensor histidine kinase n=1 Tax=Clostridium sp. TaxID=1506 RepID=UPI00302D460C
MTYLVIILSLVILGLVIHVIKTKQELVSISKQIEKSHGQYINIHTKSLNSEIEDIVKNINFLYDGNQKVNAAKKSMEDEIRQSISNMSHDLRTPLTSIMGYIQLLKSEDITSEEHEEYIDIIERRTKNLESLISSFYDLSRLEGNEYRFDLKSINLEKLLCDNIALYYNDFVGNNIEPIVEIEKNLQNIISDESSVNRVFSNLIGNSLKHGAGFVKITLKSEGNIIVTEFTNSAPDLNEGIVEQLFDRFFTADKSRNDRNTGLGLAITKGLVEKLGNEISAELLNDKLKISIRWMK